MLLFESHRVLLGGDGRLDGSDAALLATLCLGGCLVSLVLDQGHLEAGTAIVPSICARRKPAAFIGFLREAAWKGEKVASCEQVYTLEKYHKSMVDGLMVYGMMRAIKK